MITLNGINFEPHPEAKYAHDYVKLAHKISAGEDELSWFRDLFVNDLWFLVYFGLGVKCANNPFWVESCHDVETGPVTNTLDVWGREHGKSTIITIAETIQDILKSHMEGSTIEEERIAIFSYTRSAAFTFFRSIKSALESSEILRACFPDVLYDDPQNEAKKWGEETGIIVRRKSFAKEATLEAWGLLEGMPTARHFTKMKFDDIMTFDFAQSPETIQKVKDAFDMAHNLSTEGGRHRVVGTPYHHEDVIAYIEGKKLPNGEPLYHVRKKPTLEGGEFNGRPVYLSEERVDFLKAQSLQMFYSQHLLDPTPRGVQKLEGNMLRDVSPEEIPSGLYRFMLVDQAGERKGREYKRSDRWGIVVVGVEPYLDDVGASTIYILDLMLEVMDLVAGVDEVVRMYCRNGRIRELIVEKVGLSTTEVHIKNGLRAKGRYIDIDQGIILAGPKGRTKVQRIETLSYPLRNDKLKISTAIPESYRSAMRMEMNKFPFWHEDGIDALSYLYDVLPHYTFPRLRDLDAVESESYHDDSYAVDFKPNGWMSI